MSIITIFYSIIGFVLLTEVFSRVTSKDFIHVFCRPFSIKCSLINGIAITITELFVGFMSIFRAGLGIIYGI